MTRVLRLTLAYDGTGFRGWARQRDQSIRTIEGALVGVLSPLLHEEARLSVAGRTDAGVHARGQVASFVTKSGLSPERIMRAVNGTLGPEVVAVGAREAAPGFDARFSATAREYVYVIDTAALADPFTARYVWHRPGALSIGPMRTAARSLVGSHDFTSFCRHPGAGKPTVRNLQRLSITRDGERLVVRARANAFLHQMVRSLVGTLVAVGELRIEPGVMPSIIEARDRSAAGQMAPAHGLTLARVVYGRRAPVSELSPSGTRRIGLARSA